jgi:predicted ATP-grasp superfamily ATP-dependent carboligase
MPPKYYYFIEDLDITSDNIPDGVLVRQCKINIKKNFIIYNKNIFISHEHLKNMINEIIDVNDKKNNKSILISDKVINEIKNKHLDFEKLPRVIISNKSDFAHLLHNQNININKLIKKLNIIFS